MQASEDAAALRNRVHALEAELQALKADLASSRDAAERARAELAELVTQREADAAASAALADQAARTVAQMKVLQCCLGHTS
jgi:chromosome segregation ATPase